MAISQESRIFLFKARTVASIFLYTWVAITNDYLELEVDANAGFDNSLSSSNNSKAKIFVVEVSASAILSASLSDGFRATPIDTFTFFPERSSLGGAIRPWEEN